MPENTIEKLTTLFTRFPGIGPRQARRFVYFLLKNNQQNLDELSQTIQSLKKNVVQCEKCFRFFTPNGGNRKICKFCLDESRDQKTIMLLEKDSDLMAIEKTGLYTGQFFIIGGLIPILDKAPQTRIRLNNLKQRIEKDEPQEVIIALSASAEGDNTADFLKTELKNLKTQIGFQITILGRGLSTGAELEYLDNDTFNNALKNRQQTN